MLLITKLSKQFSLNKMVIEKQKKKIHQIVNYILYYAELGVYEQMFKKLIIFF